MSAKEMFEKLGFMSQLNNEHSLSYDAYDTESGWLRTVIFDLKNKTYEIHRTNIYFDIETKYTKHKYLNKAINKQVEELHWND